jgi:two-component sensor histidine kinase
MAAARLLAGTSPVARPLDEQTLLAQTLLTDLNGEPALILSVSLARDIHQQGLASQRRLGEALALSCAVFLLTLGQIGRRAAQESAVRLRAEKDLRQAHDELEERVIDRTVELSAANATLGQEIRQREKAQQSLQGTLDEKELLLRELHHRVKNSLQVITNLLYLQATEVKSPEALKALDECRGRVRSVALLHSALETASEVGRVEFCAYAELLATELLESFRPQPGEVRLHVQGEPTHLPTRQAVVSGLVLNELVTNALKHAFPNGRGGEVRLGVSSQDGDCVLEVSDDGQGLPEGMGVHEAESLGLRLVGMLVDQLDGRIEVNSTQGTQVVIRFPIAATA